jgi:hypothetical protein
MREYLKTVSTKELLEEIKFRQLSIPCSGSIKIDSSGTVKFQLENMTWPVGNYKIKVVVVEEIKEEVQYEKSDNIKEPKESEK